MSLPDGKSLGSTNGKGLRNLFCHAHGFTLLEVLVATAITGIALGVVMSLLAQGHRQAYRGDISKTAAAVAAQLVTHWQSKGKFPASEQGEMDGFQGWSYTVESEPLSTTITLPTGEIKEVQPDELVALTITINSPAKTGKFRLSLWIPASQVRQ